MFHRCSVEMHGTSEGSHRMFHRTFHRTSHRMFHRWSLVVCLELKFDCDVDISWYSACMSVNISAGICAHVSAHVCTCVYIFVCARVYTGSDRTPATCSRILYMCSAYHLYAWLFASLCCSDGITRQSVPLLPCRTINKFC